MIGAGVVGSVFPVISTEATAVFYGTEGGWHPLLVGLFCALGQCTTYVALYFGGEKLVMRWNWLARQVHKVRGRFGDRLEGGYLGFAFVGSIVGLPPMNGMMALAAGFNVRLLHIWPISFVGRLIRFTVLAAVGGSLVDLF